MATRRAPSSRGGRGAGVVDGVPARARYRRAHLRAAEAAFARCANAMDAHIGRALDGLVTLDFDSTGVKVYGHQKKGTGVNYQGQLAYQPLLCSWAQCGRLLASGLAGNDSPRGEEPRQMLGRDTGLPARRPRSGRRAL